MKAKQLIEMMEACLLHIGDRDQRSALGIADSFVRGSQVDAGASKYSDEGLPLNRDALAAALIVAVSDTSKEKAKEALQVARAWLNEPFVNDPTILAWRAQRGTIGRETAEK